MHLPAVAHRRLAVHGVRAAAAAIALTILVPFTAGSAHAGALAAYVGTGGSLGEVGFRRDGVRLPGGLVVGASAGWVAPMAVASRAPSVERSLGWTGLWLAYDLLEDGGVVVSVDTVLAHGGSCTYDSEDFDGCRALETFLVAEPSARVRIAVREDVTLEMTGGWRFVANAPSALSAPAEAFGTVTPADESLLLLEGPLAMVSIELATY